MKQIRRSSHMYFGIVALKQPNWHENYFCSSETMFYIRASSRIMLGSLGDWFSLFRWILTFIAGAFGPMINIVLLSYVGDSWDLHTLHIILITGSCLNIFGCLATMFFRKGNQYENAETLAVCEMDPNREVQISFLGMRKTVSSNLNSILILSVIMTYDIITALGSGMSVRFISLWFKNDMGVLPRTLEWSNMFTQLCVALCTLATGLLAVRTGALFCN